MATVRYWGGARDICGTGEQPVAETGLQAALYALRNEHGPRFAALLNVAAILVDGDRVALDADVALATDSLVEVLPPFAGG